MKIKKIIVLALCLILCVLFTGCSSSVSVYRTEVTDGAYTIGVDIYASKMDRAVLEKNGANLKDYLYAIAEACEVNENGGSFALDEDANGNIYATLAISVDGTYVKNEDYSYKETTGFFFNTYTIRYKNPLDKFKNDYKNGSSDLVLMKVILEGKGNLKSFTEYFGVDKSIADDLVLNFLVKTRMLYEANVPTEYVLTQKFFKWSTTVSGEDGYIEYSVKRINSWVWYTLAIIIGLALVFVLWLVSKKSKAQPVLDDQTELERMRVMSKNVPRNARIVTPPPPTPKDSEVFEESGAEVRDAEDENKD